MFALPIVEVSQVADARRRAADLANTLGFDETATGRVSIVVTELATNLIKHGGGGTLIAQAFSDPTGSGLEILALDKGRGMTDTAQSQVDGYSTSGTQGTGLGSIKRQSQSLAMYSRPDGTVIMTRLTAIPPRVPLAEPLWGAICIPLASEQVCGDGWRVIPGKTLQMFVVDGLGHGQFAHDAATAALEIFVARAGRGPKSILEDVHEGIRATRGAAVAMAEYHPDRRKVVFAGIGNIAGTIFSANLEKRTVSLAGTAGYMVRRVDTFEYPAEGADALVILHSDGIGTSWTLSKYPGLSRCHPSVIAGVIYRDFVRARDDATILVAKVSQA